MNVRIGKRLAMSADTLACVDLVQQDDKQFIDKHTLMTHSKSAANAALKELDVLLTLQQYQHQQIKTRSTKSHVVGLHGYRLDTHDQRLHLMLEHCTRGDLFKVAQQESRLVHMGVLSPSRGFTTCERGLRRVTHHILLGLRSLHACGVAHMDLSLENVLMTAKSEVKLADFALSQRFQCDVHDRPAPVVVTDGGAIAKPAYAAPELHTATLVEDVTKADVWSLGVMLWHLTTRSPLFPTGAATLQDPVFRAMSQSSSWIDQRLPEATASLRDLLRHLLDPVPATRLSVDMALQHAWLLGYDVVPTALTEALRPTSSLLAPLSISVATATPPKPTQSPSRAKDRSSRGRGRTASAEISLDTTRVTIRPSLLPKTAP